jgi:hypothetical protein
VANGSTPTRVSSLQHPQQNDGTRHAEFDCAAWVRASLRSRTDLISFMHQRHKYLESRPEAFGPGECDLQMQRGYYIGTTYGPIGCWCTQEVHNGNKNSWRHRVGAPCVWLHPCGQRVSSAMRGPAGTGHRLQGAIQTRQWQLLLSAGAYRNHHTRNKS